MESNGQVVVYSVEIVVTEDFLYLRESNCKIQNLFNLNAELEMCHAHGFGDMMMIFNANGRYINKIFKIVIELFKHFYVIAYAM